MGEVGGMATVSDEVEDVVEMVMRGYEMNLKYASETPWADAMASIEYLEDFDDLDDSELIDTLASWAGLSYNVFKGIWEDLSDKEKNEALGEIEYRIALLGFEDLLKSIAADFYVMENKDVREKIISAARKYVNGEIDFYDLSVELENIFWPTEKDRKENAQALRHFWDGIGLTDYIEENKVKELVKRYLIDELEAIGKTPDLGEPGP
jgi:hypothetical protein